MNEEFTLSYCELRAKEVINVIDGKRLGRIIDIIFSSRDCGEIKGIIVPYVRRAFFARREEVFVPWNCIRKIGEDVILLDMVIEPNCSRKDRTRDRRIERDERFDESRGDRDRGDRGRSAGERGDNYYSVNSVVDEAKQNLRDEKQQCVQQPASPNCDHKCEKCMLFDCAYRWKNL